ncbi:MAG: aspartate aminotransferase family protein, partial [Pseudomonadota bacterium]
MNLSVSPNDLNGVVEADRAHVWHHLIQHAGWAGPDAKGDPRIIVEGKGLRVWDQHGKEHID